MAEAVEFTAKVKDGVIKLPERYKALANAFVKIILLKKEQKLRSNKKEVIESLTKVQGKGIFSTIEDPVKWQREQRDEWE